MASSSTQVGFHSTLRLHHGRAAVEAVQSCHAAVRFFTEFTHVTLKCRGVVRGDEPSTEEAMMVPWENYGEIAKGDFPRLEQVGAWFLRKCYVCS